jgi:hypothetical protein
LRGSDTVPGSPDDSGRHTCSEQAAANGHSGERLSIMKAPEGGHFADTAVLAIASVAVEDRPNKDSSPLCGRHPRVGQHGVFRSSLWPLAFSLPSGPTQSPPGDPRRNDSAHGKRSITSRFLTVVGNIARVGRFAKCGCVPHLSTKRLDRLPSAVGSRYDPLAALCLSAPFTSARGRNEGSTTGGRP